MTIVFQLSTLNPSTVCYQRGSMKWCGEEDTPGKEIEKEESVKQERNFSKVFPQLALTASQGNSLEMQFFGPTHASRNQ